MTIHFPLHIGAYAGDNWAGPGRLLYLELEEGQVTSLRFNPPKKFARFALFVGDEQSGTLRTFDELAFAKISWHYHAKGYGSGSRNPAKILENVEGQWYVLYDIPKGTKQEDLPWYKQSWRYFSSTPARVAKPMTRDEYADWRVAVERERLGFQAATATGPSTTVNSGVR